MAEQKPEHYSSRRSSHVRFDGEEYRSIAEDAVNTGKSIPTLLKEKYFKGPRPLPLMAKADVGKVLGELGRIGNKVNQLARRLNSGIREGFVSELVEIQESLLLLMEFLVGLYCRCKPIRLKVQDR